MKSSLCNFFVPYNDRIICFNGMSSKIFSVNKEECEVIKKQITNPDANSQLCEFLKKYNFIIDENVDEKKRLRLLNRASTFANYHDITVNPTIDCNFSCWYCYQDHKAGRMSDETMEALKKYIKILVEARSTLTSTSRKAGR